MQQERGFIILDFGSQLTQLIARRLRELHYYCEIFPFDLKLDLIKSKNPYGIILSGGPSSVYESGAPKRSIQELREIAPLLGICYGMQLISAELGGQVESATHREYGYNLVNWSNPIGKTPRQQKVWMSHGDIVKKIPPGFELIAKSESGHPAAMKSKDIWGVQFHPEVAHTEYGIETLKAFAQELCGASPTWQSQHIVANLKAKILEKIPGHEQVLVGLSGGVDSTVVAVLLTQTLGADRVHCIFVNNGLLRKNEYDQVLAACKGLGLNIHGVDASKEFLAQLAGVSDPEKKRKTIGRVFIEIFEKQMQGILTGKNIKWLAQGTLYPDVIESVSFKGPSQTIKSHHNVGGLPARMKLALVEPLRELFKDEVRDIGRNLGLAPELLGRHPFPGPGLAIRIIGEVTEESLRIVREADAIFIAKLREHGLYNKIWQAFCVLLPVRTVGVQGDGRTFDQVLSLRAVTSLDGMTADWFDFSGSFLREVSSAITNQVRGVSRVVYDITSKPPATIEWE